MQLDESAYLDYVYKLRSSDYRVDFTIRGHELRRFLPVNIALQDIEWRQRIPQQEQSWKFEGQYSGIYYHYPSGRCRPPRDDQRSQRRYPRDAALGCLQGQVLSAPY